MLNISMYGVSQIELKSVGMLKKTANFIQQKPENSSLPENDKRPFLVGTKKLYIEDWV